MNRFLSACCVDKACVLHHHQGLVSVVKDLHLDSGLFTPTCSDCY